MSRPRLPQWPELPEQLVKRRKNEREKYLLNQVRKSLRKGGDTKPATGR